jgi:ABC-type multidrug transport system ATPase subunit
MGIVYQRDVHWEYLTVDENLDLMLQLRGISLENNQRKEDFKKMLGLD